MLRKNMRINLHIISSVAAVAVTCCISAAAYYYRRYTSEINEVMIFCKLQYNPYNYFNKLLSFIESAKHSVNVCMPGIHNPAIQGKLVQLIKRKNIKVQIIIDRAGYKKSTELFVKELIDAGAEIKFKLDEPPHNMQHKFCLIDDKILMTGTLNWGNDLSMDHWNYVFITSKLPLVAPVQQEFYKMWNSFTNDWQALDKQPVLYDSDIETLNSDNKNLNDACTDRETMITPEVYIP